MSEKLASIPRRELRQRIEDFSSILAKSLSLDRRIFSPELISKASGILENHSRVVENMKSEKFINLLRSEREIKGDAKIGYVQCVDGRLQSIFFSRIVNVWEEPASLFAVEGESGKPVVASKELRTALEREAAEGRDLFEIVFAHTSLRTDHVCGYMNGMRKSGIVDPHMSNDELVKENLRRVEAEQIPAITNTYNGARQANPLPLVAISAVFDTDTMGTVVNYGKENQLSTTDILEKEGFKEKIAKALGGDDSAFGSWRKRFTNPNYFLDFYGKAVETTAQIIGNADIGLGDRLKKYIGDNFADLTASQKQAFLFSLARTIAHQYLTGLSVVPADEHGHEHPDHPFGDHGERFATISSSGEGVLDRFNTSRIQSFGITSSTPEAAVQQARDVALPLLDKFDDDKDSHILFVSTTIGKDDDVNAQWETNRRYYEALLSDEKIMARIREGGLLMIPVMVKTTGEIVDIPKHVNQ